MGKRGISAILVFAIFAVVSVVPVDVSADRRPVEGKWIVEGARGLQLPSSPLTYHLLEGDKATLLFRVEEGDLDLYNRSFARLVMPEALKPMKREGMSAEEVQSFVIGPEIPGTYDVALRMESAELGFTLEYPVRLVVHSELSSIEEALAPVSCPGPVIPDPPGKDANPENPAARRELAPENYAHIYGLAMTYNHPNSRRYMLRGLKLELREGSTVLATVHTSDPIGEGRCETSYADYILTTDNSYHHVTNSGSFDFGNIYVGPSGKTLIIREIFQFYAGASGTAADGAHRFTTEEYGTLSNSQIFMDWQITVGSGHENAIWLQSGTFTLSASNGYLGDEAMHVQLDASRMYHFFAECAGWSSSDITRFIIDLADTDSPYCEGLDVYFNAWNNGYMQYPWTDSIRHEYTHSFHWKMRGGSFPPFASGGSSNHGGCANPNSADALLEGYARYAPTTTVWDDLAYDWSSGSSRYMDYCGNYCTSVPDDRDEWAVGHAMWKTGELSGGRETFFNCSCSALFNGDPDYVQNYFNGITANCLNDRATWDGFWCSEINYDTTPPDNPSPITCATGPLGWTNDPTWSWSEPYDDLSGIGGYSLELAPGFSGVLPDTIRDIDAVTSYHPATLPADGLYTFCLRTQDRAGNWNGGFSNHAVGLDRTPPGPGTGLWASSPPYQGDWSNYPYLSPSWTPAADNLSGIDGYSWEIVNSTSTLPNQSKDIEEDITAVNATLSSSTDTQYFALRSKDNAGNWSATAAYLGPFFIDTVAPGAVTDLHSTSHTGGTWSNDTTVDFSWTQAPDSHSGIQGYSICSNTLACEPVEAMTIGNVTSTTLTLDHSDVGYYTSLRAVDNAGNWANAWPTWGPVMIDTVRPTAPGNLNGNHPLGTEGCTTGDTEFSASWTPSYDGNSGIAAYAYTVSFGDWQRPPEADHLPAGATFVSLTVPNSSQPQFFNIMSRDAAGNWSDFIAYGPFFHDRSPLPVEGALLLSFPGAPDGALSIEWNGTGELGYLVEWVTGFDAATPDDWSDNANYGAAETAVQAYTHNSPPSAQCVFYRVKGKNACGVLGN